MAFCFVFVTLFSMLFGSDNSVAGVVFLLALLVLRQADFGIRTSHGLICIACIFTLLITGPRLANTLSTPASLLVNFISILLLMILGCHNVIMYNQSTFVLGYLLLYGYDVTGRAYLLQVRSLLSFGKGRHTLMQAMPAHIARGSESSCMINIAEQTIQVRDKYHWLRVDFKLNSRNRSRKLRR